MRGDSPLAPPILALVDALAAEVVEAYLTDMGRQDAGAESEHPNPAPLPAPSKAA